MTRRRATPVGGSWDWLLRRWGGERWRIMTGQKVLTDLDGYVHVHVDGWPDVSAAAMASEGGITGGSGNATQHFPEVYSEEALFIWRAFNRLAEKPREWLTVHYVVPGPPDFKARHLGYSVADYFTLARTAADTIVKLLDAEVKV